MLHDGWVSGAGVTTLIPIDRYPQVFSMTHLVILLYVIFPPHCRILSRLEDILYPPPLHANIMSPSIYLQMVMDSLAASPRYSGPTTTIYKTRNHERTFWQRWLTPFVSTAAPSSQQTQHILVSTSRSSPHLTQPQPFRYIFHQFSCWQSSGRGVHLTDPPLVFLSLILFLLLFLTHCLCRFFCFF